jgi:hypothetical protein
MMVDPTQYWFELREVTEALVRERGLTSGQWVLAFEFNFAAMMTGPNSNEVKPSAMIQVNRLKLTQAGPDVASGVPVVDAAKVSSRKKINASANNPAEQHQNHAPKRLSASPPSHRVR